MSIRLESGVHVCRLAGSLTIREIPYVRRLLRPLLDQAELQTLLLDCECVDFIDSHGIGFLLTCVEILAKRQAHLMLCQLAPPVLETFLQGRLEAIFELYPSPQAALARTERIYPSRH